MTAPDATSVDWKTIRHFSPDEFEGWEKPWPELPAPPKARSMLPYMDARVPQALDALREALGSPLLVSRAPGAIARTWNPGSQHYCVGRLSLACDLWVPDATLEDAYKAAQSVEAIGAFGAYPEWHTHPGIHVDLRPRKPDGALHTWMARYVGSQQVYLGLNWRLVDQLIRAR